MDAYALLRVILTLMATLFLLHKLLGWWTCKRETWSRKRRNRWNRRRRGVSPAALAAGIRVSDVPEQRGRETDDFWLGFLLGWFFLSSGNSKGSSGCG
jgi:hypothetical protein